MSNFNNEKFTVMKCTSPMISDTTYVSTEPYHATENSNLHASCDKKKEINLFNGVTVTNSGTIFPVGVTDESTFTKTCVDTEDGHQGLEATVFESEILQSPESRNPIGSMNQIAPATFIDASFTQVHQKGDRWKNLDRDSERSAAYILEKQVANDVSFGLPCKSPNNYYIVAPSGWSFPDHF